MVDACASSQACKIRLDALLTVLLANVYGSPSRPFLGCNAWNTSTKFEFNSYQGCLDEYLELTDPSKSTYTQFPFMQLDLASGGLCSYFYSTIKSANDNFAASTLFTPTLLSPDQLNTVVAAQVQANILQVINQVNQHVSLIRMYQTMEKPITGAGYQPSLVSTGLDAVSNAYPDVNIDQALPITMKVQQYAAVTCSGSPVETTAFVSGACMTACPPELYGYKSCMLQAPCSAVSGASVTFFGWMSSNCNATGTDVYVQTQTVLSDPPLGVCRLSNQGLAYTSVCNTAVNVLTIKVRATLTMFIWFASRSSILCSHQSWVLCWPDVPTVMFRHIFAAAFVQLRPVFAAMFQHHGVSGT